MPEPSLTVPADEGILERRQEVYTMAFYVSICLLAALAAVGDTTQVEVVKIVGGTTVGLALVHWFAFRVSARPVGKGSRSTQPTRGRFSMSGSSCSPGVEIDSEADLPETEEELLADFVYVEDEVEAGESKTLTITTPAAGPYQVICAIETHFDAGMVGTLTVVDES
ncbi:MAG: hypothetical protein ACRDWS_00840 [Acidimicrobiia bacterium]